MWNKAVLAILTTGIIFLIALNLMDFAPIDEHTEQVVAKSMSNKSPARTNTTTDSNSIPEILTNANAQANADEDNAGMAQPEDPIARIKAIQNKTALHRALVKEHQAFSRYDPNNRRFESPDDDPLAERYAIDERTTTDEETDTSLTIWTDQKYYLYGDRVQVFARLTDAKGTPIQTDFVGQLIYNEQTTLQNFAFTPAPEPGLFTHALELSSQSSSEYQPGIYKILIANRENALADAVTFILSKPDIQLTGNFRDSITSNGDLLIEAEVEVSSDHRYYVQASLYSENGAPIGTTEVAEALLAGQHWLPLNFDGQLFQDAQEPGPYFIKSLSLAKVALPIQRAPLLKPDFFTQAYAVHEFKASADNTSDGLPN